MEKTHGRELADSFWHSLGAEWLKIKLTHTVRFNDLYILVTMIIIDDIKKPATSFLEFNQKLGTSPSFPLPDFVTFRDLRKTNTFGLYCHPSHWLQKILTK